MLTFLNSPDLFSSSQKAKDFVHITFVSIHFTRAIAGQVGQILKFSPNLTPAEKELLRSSAGHL
jgi:hypothetical protein